MARNTVDVTDATFGDDVLQSDKTVLVDFWAEWCGPCKMIAPVLDEIAGEHREKLTVAKLDIDRSSRSSAPSRRPRCCATLRTTWPDERPPAAPRPVSRPGRTAAPYTVVAVLRVTRPQPDAAAPGTGRAE